MSSPCSIGLGNRITPNLANRSAHREAAFLLPYIWEDARILDVGCGPGPISCDFAQLVPHGYVVGVDLNPTSIESAVNLARQRDIKNIGFQQGDVLKGLNFKDAEFDIVFCHQLIVHVDDPVKVLREMKRLTKPNGIVACREYLTVLWYPSNQMLEELNKWIPNSPLLSGADDITALPHVWAREAGFEPKSITNTISGLVSSTVEEKQDGVEMFGHMFAEGSLFRDKLQKRGASNEDFEKIAMALKEWMDHVDGWSAWLSSEMVCRANENTGKQMGTGLPPETMNGQD